ncbi:MAG: aromatic acid exporter family protein [Oscillospiraceae bacterium]|nr:aromatic acid exporter family protein [Oscillospiraceae bacterium]
MRSVKTAVAVAACYFISIPFQVYASDIMTVDAFTACVTAAICMQSSMEESIRLGLYRLVGTLLGGALGLLVLLVGAQTSLLPVTGLILGVSILLCIWLCNLFGIQAACVVACMTVCLVLLNYNGEDRYLHTLLRMVETAVGVVVALVVNRVLPSRHMPGQADEAAEAPEAIPEAAPAVEESPEENPDDENPNP